MTSPVPFSSLGVPADLVDALDARGITTAFPVQAATIPDALDGRDVSGRAPTGSGKTIAFGVPLVARVRRAAPKKPKALVLLPTRELASQVARDLTDLGRERGVRVHSFYGGVGFDGQLKALRRGVDVAVACPGRLADLVNQRHIRLDAVEIVVVDEADRMADMGFLPEVKRLLDQTKPDRQTLLFSATLDGDVDVLVKRYQRDPVVHDVAPPEGSGGRVDHHFWQVERSARTALVADIVRRTGSTVVFTRTRHGADRLARQLSTQGVDAVAIHGNRTQGQRDRALGDFTRGRAQALVATDVAARGIHVDDVACVVHHDLPADAKDYVHRSGRTGRAEADGVVVALVLPDQRKAASQIRRALDIDVDLVDASPEVLGDAVAVGAAPPREERRPASPEGRSTRPARARTDKAGGGPARSGRPRRDGERRREVGGRQDAEGRQDVEGRRPGKPSERRSPRPPRAGEGGGPGGTGERGRSTGSRASRPPKPAAARSGTGRARAAAGRPGGPGARPAASGGRPAGAGGRTRAAGGPARSGRPGASKRRSKP